MIKRRDLLATGVAGSTALALGGGLGMSASEAQAQVVPPVSALDAASLAILRVWVPVILGNSALPTEATARQASINLIAQRAGEIVSNYPPVNKAGIVGLFTTLKGGPQIFNAGFPATWEAMPASLLAALLEGLRVSQAASQRGIFSAFMGLIPNAHYSNPINWPAISYPGPPKFA
ncbi:MAG: hypothetical protein H7Y33_19140 [Cytophagales bacterium]|nr:hypothetical protein [Rhizobacter sp.]